MRVNRCPMCGAGAERALIARDRNREITQARFVYDRCHMCSSVFLTSIPDDLARYYGGGYYPFGVDGEADWQEDELLLRVEAYRTTLLLRHVGPGRLIEIGAGTGGFSAAAAKAGFRVSAVEMDERCCRYLSERVGVEAIHSDRPVEALAAFPQVRVVAMWHVLEHLPNPAEVLAAAAERLEPGGILALGVPNPDSLQFRLLGSRWAHLDAPRHLALIPARTLMRYCAKLGLTCLELTTNDPFGQHCNVHGWTYALLRRPGAGPAAPHSPLGLALARLVRPIERRDLFGSALLLIFRREDS